MANASVHGVTGESLTHCFNEIAFNLVCRQFPSDDTVLVNGDIIERAGIRRDGSTDIRIAGCQPAIRASGKTSEDCRMT